MRVEELLGKDLIKQLEATTRSHAKFTKDNSKLKSILKKAMSIKELETITDVVNAHGYPDDKIIIAVFQEKVNSGNIDDNDIYEFKKVIEPYMEQIEIELERMARQE